MSFETSGAGLSELVSCCVPAALSAICVPVKARNRNINVPISSPRKAAISLRTVVGDFGAASDGCADEGSWTGRVGSLLLYFSAVSFPVMKDIRLCLLRTVMSRE